MQIHQLNAFKSHRQKCLFLKNDLIKILKCFFIYKNRKIWVIVPNLERHCCALFHQSALGGKIQTFPSRMSAFVIISILQQVDPAGEICDNNLIIERRVARSRKRCSASTTVGFSPIERLFEKMVNISSYHTLIRSEMKIYSRSPLPRYYILSLRQASSFLPDKKKK